jgi:DnaJ-domain-containing protein 1
MLGLWRGCPKERSLLVAESHRFKVADNRNEKGSMSEVRESNKNFTLLFDVAASLVQLAASLF